MVPPSTGLLPELPYIRGTEFWPHVPALLPVVRPPPRSPPSLPLATAALVRTVHWQGLTSLPFAIFWRASASITVLSDPVSTRTCAPHSGITRMASLPRVVGQRSVRPVCPVLTLILVPFPGSPILFGRDPQARTSSSFEGLSAGLSHLRGGLPGVSSLSLSLPVGDVSSPESAESLRLRVLRPPRLRSVSVVALISIGSPRQSLPEGLPRSLRYM